MKRILPILSFILAATLNAATPAEIIAKAEAGDLDAMAYAADKMRWGGKGWPKDKLKSDQFMKVSAEKGNPEGAVVYCINQSVPPEQKEKLLRKAAEAGHARAFYPLASVVAGKYSKSQDERNKFAIESYAWAKLALDNKDQIWTGPSGFVQKHEAEKLVDGFAGYVDRLRYDAANSKKSSSLLSVDSPDRVAAKAQDAAKQLAERMKKKFPGGFPAWPPSFDDAPVAQPAK